MTKGRHYISGIQQIGLGNTDVHETWRWYREHFGFDVPVFNEAAEAGLMLPYTGGQPQKRHAILAINLRGGGGLEIWQYTERTPQPVDFQLQVGDLGIYVSKIKSSDIQAAHAFLAGKEVGLLGDISQNPAGQEHFFLQDLHGNVVEVVESGHWFQPGKFSMGGVVGCTIGVSDMDASVHFYRGVLGFDEVVFDKSGIFPDLTCLPGGDGRFRRVLLRHTEPRKGAFSRFFSNNEIELVQATNRTPRKIFEGRYWGDPGYIHLCFDITGMASMKALCEEHGCPFTVDSSDSFDMGDAAGHFSYIEDPDGTLIEFVETHKMHLIKKLGWKLDLRKRQLDKPLPDWMLKSLRLGRVK
ncbi:MAG: VOC family protein [Lewinellaceae bacterium]|nr:VOC family protein [Saprospiraceae bacterium]MCB9340477.1 VOC family protein [Lewinellaceae bacterium]